MGSSLHVHRMHDRSIEYIMCRKIQATLGNPSGTSFNSVLHELTSFGLTCAVPADVRERKRE